MAYRPPAQQARNFALGSTRHFDAEDARLLTSLGCFAGAALEMLTSLDQTESNLSARRQAEDHAVAVARNADLFIAILAHELRNPLGPICNAAQLLKGGMLDAAATRRVSDIIDRQANVMSRLIDDLLQIEQLRLGNLDFRHKIVTVSEVVERTLETIGPFVAARDHVLMVSLPPEPIQLDADSAWLSRALQNLLRNASKYTNPGGEIHIDALRDGDEAVITVSDNGIGIAPTQLDAIFDIWEQAEQAATERSEGGAGIGLYLVRRLIEAHGGTVRAASGAAADTKGLQATALRRPRSPMLQIAPGSGSSVRGTARAAPGWHASSINSAAPPQVRISTVHTLKTV